VIATIVRDPLLDLVVRAALALLFAGAAFHKLRDTATFREIVRAYRVVPPALLWASPVVAAVEGGLALALLVPRWRALAALAAAVVLVAYAAAIAANVVRGRRDIECGCGAPGTRQPLSGWLVGRNLVLALAAVATALPPSHRPFLWLDGVALAGTLVVLWCAWTAGHRLLAASSRAAAFGVAR
jgi:hypothetical protein